MRNSFLSSLLAVTISVTASGFGFSAQAADYTKFREADGTEKRDIYQVFVTLKNAGLESDGKAAYLATPDARPGLQEGYMAKPQLADAPAHTTIWRFNIFNDGYALMSNWGYYLGRNEKKEVSMCGNWRPDANPNANTYKWDVEYLADGTARIYAGEEYLSVTTANGTPEIVYTTTPDKYSVWHLDRAYKSTTMDLPFNTPSPSKEKNLFTFQLNDGRYFSISNSGRNFNALPSSDRVYWYFIYETDGSGRARLVSMKDIDAWCNAGNGYYHYGPDANGNRQTGHWIFYPVKETSDGLVLTPTAGNQYPYTLDNQCAAYYDANVDWVCGSQRLSINALNGISPDVWAWHIKIVDDNNALQFSLDKTAYINTLNELMANQPWGHKRLGATIGDISALDYEAFTSGDAANARLNELRKQALDDILADMHTEAVGTCANICNVRRKASGMAPYLSGYMEGADVTLNSASVVRTTGQWVFEDAGDGQLCIRNRQGFYLGSATSGKETRSTTTASRAGKYKFAIDGSSIIIFCSTEDNALNLDGRGNNLTAAAATDEGSKWTILEAGLTEAVEGMPQSSVSDNRLTYLIKSAADPTRYISGCYTNVLLRCESLTQDSYWYFTENPLNDSYYFVNDYWNTVLRTHEEFIVNEERIASGTPFYIVPAVKPDGTKEGFMFTTKVPAEDGTVICRDGVKSFRLGNADNWEACAFLFEFAQDVDHERIFKARAEEALATLEKMLKASPFAHNELGSLRDKILNSTMTDWGARSQEAIDALNTQLNRAIEDAEMALEVEPEKTAINFVNLRRESLGQPAYLAASGTAVNTTDKGAVAESTWTPVYVSNGRYHLMNGNGKFLAPASAEIGLVDDEAEAGMYRFIYQNGDIAVSVHNDRNSGLNINANGGNLCSYGVGDPGSVWRIETSAYSSVDTIGEDAASAPVEFYNIQGMRIDASRLTPGVYIRRQGNRAEKVVVE